MSAKTLLCCLDMDGCWLARTEDDVKGLRSSVDPFVLRNGAFVRHVYARPGAPQLLDWLLTQTHLQLALYTSMMDHNAKAILDHVWRCLERKEKILVGGGSGDAKEPQGVWLLGRDWNKKDPLGKNDWDTMRDLDRVWKAHPQFDASNTVLIDNEARKVREVAHNAVLVSDWSTKAMSVDAMNKVGRGKPLSKPLARFARR
jgi:hypothetical protein